MVLFTITSCGSASVPATTESGLEIVMPGSVPDCSAHTSESAYSLRGDEHTPRYTSASANTTPLAGSLNVPNSVAAFEVQNEV
jgi:hypothetical protein